MPDKVKVLLIGQTPPPYSGQALMLERLVHTRFARLEVHHVRMAFSASVQSIGRFEMQKVAHLVQVIWRALVLRFRRGVQVLVFPPAGPRWNPVLRDIALLLVLRPFFRKTVFTFQAAGVSEFLESRPKLVRRLAMWAYGRPDGAIHLSRLLPPDAEYFRAKRVVVIPNGIEDTAPPYIQKERPAEGTVRILYVGFIDERKGAMALLEAVSTLARTGLNFAVTFIGEFTSKAFEQRARRFCEEHGLDDRISFVGQRLGDEKWEQFHRADILCMPSHFESEALPLVVIEAMMFQLPVVATRWRGIPDLIDDGVSGYLVPIRDPQALADALSRLISDSTLRRTMGANARRRYLDQFTIERYLQRTEDFLLEFAE